MTTTQATRRRAKKQGTQAAEAAVAAATPETAAPPAPAAKTTAEQHREAVRVADAGPEQPAFWPAGNGRFYFWAATRDDNGQQTAYRIRAVDGGWQLVKPDGTRYYVEDRSEGLSCDCPGCTAHGPRCNGGKGCKHMRLIRALHAMFV